MWHPFANSPQEKAYNSEAHEVLFGYGAGGGKTSLCVGLAATMHQRSLLLRREPTQCADMIDTLLRVVGSNGKWQRRGCGGTMVMDDRRTIAIGGCETEDDKFQYAGIPYDLIALDEVASFTKAQVDFILGLNRSDDPAQRCRILMTGNPPLPTNEHWLTRWFAPWLMMDWAQSGEILRGRTVIKATFRDNPYLAASEYGDALLALPEPLRSSLAGS